MSMMDCARLLMLAVVLVSCGMDRQKTEISYPGPLPDSVSRIFLPGVVSTDSFDFNSAFSPDGKAYYFSRRSDKQSDIFVTRLKEGQWSQAEQVSFNTREYSEADPAFDAEGKMFFISDRPKADADSVRDYDIWYTTLQSSGRWSEPELLTIVNTDSSEFYISFSQSGNLYFASGRAGGFGEEDLYVSRLSEGKYQQPENLGSTINTIHPEYDPGISADEKIIAFTSSGREDTVGGADLYAAFRNEDKWNNAKHLSKTINTPSREFCSYFSFDSKYFFYSSEGDVKWIEVKSIVQQIK